jgi:hypothetical protein
MEAEFHGDERDYEPGGIYYDGPLYALDDDGDEIRDTWDDDCSDDD